VLSVTAQTEPQLNRIEFQQRFSTQEACERAPPPKRFSATCAISTDKRGYSSLQLPKDVGVSHAAWLMLHKIREGMSSRDKKYLLSGTAEMDEAYFAAPEKGVKRKRDENLGFGRAFA
jgi:hypothetical protein